MSRWQEFLRSQGARFDGFELLDFGDPQAGQGASTLLTGLSHEGVIQVSGVESEKFLQGQLTCDLREVDSHHARLGALCTYQGRAVATFILNRIGSDYHLQLDRSALPQLLATLGKYIVFSKATLRDASDEWVRIGLAGHHASELLAASAPLHKQLRHALKSGELTVEGGEPLIDAALRAGVIDAAQARQLREAETARRRVIDVDAFSKEELLPVPGKVR